jgi:hypothetical protein
MSRWRQQFRNHFSKNVGNSAKWSDMTLLISKGWTRKNRHQLLLFRCGLKKRRREEKLQDLPAL